MEIEETTRASQQSENQLNEPSPGGFPFDNTYARELDGPPGIELYRRDAPIVEELPHLYDDGSDDRVVV